MDLTQLKAGEKAVFMGAEGGCGMIAKLEAMGIRPSITITKISAQFMHGPVIIKAGNTQLAIGFGMAKRIMVEKLGEQK
jgi:ferrous iron transport protein A